MTCTGCQRIRRVIGIKRRVGVDGVNPDSGLFADGLTWRQKGFHVGCSLVVLALGIWMILVAAWGLAVVADWVAYLISGEMT